MRRPLPLVLLLIVLSASAATGQQALSLQPHVLVLLRSASGSEFESLRLLIVDAIRLELSSRGLDTVAPPDPWKMSDSPPSLARRAGTEFALAGTYLLAEDEQVTIELRLIEAASSLATAAISRSGPLDLTFDALVAGAIGEALDGQKERIVAARNARAEAVRAAAEAAEAEKAAAEKAAAEQAAAEQAAAEQAEAERAAAERAAIEKAAAEKARLEAKAEADRMVAAALTRPVRRWCFSLGGGPFLATVEASEYFTLGLSLGASGQYRLPLPGGLLGVGLATGLQGFRASGTESEADSLLVPLGATLVYGTNTGSRFDFYAHVDLGAALFVLRPVGGNAAAGVVPYALGGVGMTFALFDWFGIALDASYAAFFPVGVPIMGFTPSLSMVLRF